MLNQLKLWGIVSLCALSFLGERSAYADDAAGSKILECIVMIGSAEHPDPVLKRVQDLEKKGLLQNVIVMESFPVQIKVCGPKDVIEKLQTMPRKVSPDFK